MATNRKRVPRSRTDTGLTGAEEMYLFGKTEKHVNPFEELNLEYAIHSKAIKRVKELWDNYKAGILEQWIEEHPCSRPEKWWEFDTTENRLRLGGIGKHNEYSPCFKNGIPKSWYPSKDNSPPWSKSSIPDPPCFESQAAYLQRLNLLTPAEKQHLKKHPELLQSEVI
ncbi:MAG: hypothetical protein A2Y12_19105 [Planctomycetes bacterium GWF2_42_9]|nr:MAG: hypothetical protein A2Y12_19105 [Planctomycetes bacterium GWF2_42_9]